MKILDNLQQGTDEWLEVRLNNLCASEAPAIMGDSKFMNRNQLLDLKKGWQSNQNSSFKERLFQKGHEHEEAARKILELERLEDFKPICGLIELQGMKLMASFDGLGEDSNEIWEHKDWNTVLAENVRNNLLTPHYYWQLEHQALVAGTESVIFTCSDGTHNNRVTTTYVSVPERREQLIAGWKQFSADLETHQLKAKQEAVIADEPESLPIVTYEVVGTNVVSNIGSILPAVKERAQQEMARVLETDQDFADKDLLNKSVKAARAKLKEQVASIQSKFVSLADFSTMAQELDDVLQKMQAHGEKQVKQAKETKKSNIADGAMLALRAYIESCNDRISPMNIESIIGGVEVDWKAAMRNKRTIESLQAGVDEELARQKTAINQAMEQIEPNLEYLSSESNDYKLLFQDAQSIVNQNTEAFKAIVNERISTHKRQEEERMAAERERIEPKTATPEPVQDKPASTPVYIADQDSNPEETVTITANEYWQLQHSEALLDALLANGVDNWEGYEAAIEYLN